MRSFTLTLAISCKACLPPALPALAHPASAAEAAMLCARFSAAVLNWSAPPFFEMKANKRASFLAFLLGPRLLLDFVVAALSVTIRVRPQRLPSDTWSSSTRASPALEGSLVDSVARSHSSRASKHSRLAAIARARGRQGVHAGRREARNCRKDLGSYLRFSCGSAHA
jgi:hypothetical protein